MCGISTSLRHLASAHMGERLIPRRRRAHGMPFLAQDELEGVAGLGFVIHHHNAGHGDLAPYGMHVSCRPRIRTRRKGEAHCRAGTRGTAHLDHTVMRCDNLMRHIQAQTEFPGFRRLQKLEEPTQLCGWHATAVSPTSRHSCCPRLAA